MTAISDKSFVRKTVAFVVLEAWNAIKKNTSPFPPAIIELSREAMPIHIDSFLSALLMEFDSKPTPHTQMMMGLLLQQCNSPLPEEKKDTTCE